MALRIFLKGDAIYAGYDHGFHFVQREIAWSDDREVVGSRTDPGEQQQGKQELLQATNLVSAERRFMRRRWVGPKQRRTNDADLCGPREWTSRP